MRRLVDYFVGRMRSVTTPSLGSACTIFPAAVRSREPQRSDELLVDLELLADQAAEGVLDFGMAGNRSLAAVAGIPKEVVTASVAVEHAAFLRQLPQEGRAFHAGTSIGLVNAPG